MQDPGEAERAEAVKDNSSKHTKKERGNSGTERAPDLNGKRRSKEKTFAQIVSAPLA